MKIFGLLWRRWKMAVAYTLMEEQFSHRLNVVDEHDEISCVIWSRDKRTYDYNFTVRPRFHRGIIYLTPLAIRV